MTRRRNHVRSLATASLAAALALGPVAPATGDPGAETHVDDVLASVSGGTVSVSGQATFVDGPVVVADDPAGDAWIPGAGTDLTTRTVRATVGPDGPSLTLTAFIDDNPESPNPITETLVYSWQIGTRFLVAVRNGALSHPPDTSPVFRLEENDCPLGCLGDPTSTSLAGTIESDRVEWDLPLTLIDAMPGSPVGIGVTVASMQVATSEGSSPRFPSDYTPGGRINYDVPLPSVSLGIAPEGTPADEVPLTGAATVGSDGSFDGSLPAGERTPGNYVVAAEACFGQGPCALASTTVTI